MFNIEKKKKKNQPHHFKFIEFQDFKNHINDFLLPYYHYL